MSCAVTDRLGSRPGGGTHAGGRRRYDFGRLTPDPSAGTQTRGPSRGDVVTLANSGDLDAHAWRHPLWKQHYGQLGRGGTRGRMLLAHAGRIQICADRISPGVMTHGVV